MAIGIRTRIVPTTWTSLRSAWSTGNAGNIAWTHRGLAFAGVVQGLIASVQSSNLFATYANDYTDAAVAAIGRETGYPVTVGVLTTEDLEQALQRAGGKVGNKGFESAQALLEMIDLARRLAE